MLITSDGTIGDISRESYIPAEERIVREMKSIGKPFAMVLNSADPSSENAIRLAYELEEKYEVPVALVSCMDLDAEDIRHILELVLNEFPVSEISFELPGWMNALDCEHGIKSSLRHSICSCADKIRKTGELRKGLDGLNGNDYIRSYQICEVDLGTGKAKVALQFDDALYYQVLSELSGFEIANETVLIDLLKNLSVMQGQYQRVAEALEMAEEKGYGIVMPSIDELRLEEPKIVKQSGGYGVRLCASAQSIHLIRANIETEINPIVGTEQQSQDLVRYMLKEFESEPGKIWDSNVFGKSLYELVNEGLHTKLDHMSDESRTKLSETLERIINEGSGGLICIIL
jgi:stage IV sporulation protein A